MMQPSIKFLKPAIAQTEGKFTANLTGQDEVPPTNTKSTGTANFVIHSNGKIMSYSVNVNNINKVTMVTINQGKKGENGPVVVTHSFQEPNTQWSNKRTVSTGQYILYRSDRTIERNANIGFG